MMDLRKTFFRRYLDPADRLNEILFGLIMVLTFTLTAGLTVEHGADEVRTLLVATIGCNIAWGVIDAALYLMAQLLDASRRARTVARVKAASDESTAFAEIAKALEGTILRYANEAERSRVFGTIRDVARRAPIEPPRLAKEDYFGAIASGVLVMLTTVPAALPFLVISEPWRALRVSNLLLVILLFWVGHQWGKSAHASPWRTGFGFLAIGLLLVAIAIALGG
jgi:VIT1/CCC1 family predicted Fe2+/Mn2+ transporter